MAAPHLCGLITALLDKENGFLKGEFMGKKDKRFFVVV